MHKNQIEKLAPSIYTKQAHKKTTDRYKAISTPEMIELLSQYGWEVTNARQLNVRKKSNQGFQKHFVWFKERRFKGIYNQHSDLEHLVPEIMISNSYNGKSSYHFNIFVLRKVCENGFYITDRVLESLKIPHRGQIDNLEEVIHNILNHIPIVVEKIEVLQRKLLNQNQAEQLAHRLYSLRFIQGEFNSAYIKELVKPQRVEDSKRTAWNVMNIIQEKIIKGGFVQHNNRIARPIENFDRIVKLNEELFQTTIEFIEKK